MSSFEYQVVPAPRKSNAPRKVKGPEAKFATTLTDVMNEMAAQGWDYQRAETLPCEERQGFTGKTIKYHTVLVFRREIKADAVTKQVIDVAAPAAVAAPVAAPPVIPAPKPREEAGKVPSRPDPVLTNGARRPDPHDGPVSEGFIKSKPADDAKKSDVAAE